MSVQFSRRKLCRLVASIPVALPLYKLSAATAEKTQQSYIRVKTDYAEPLIRKNSLLLVDTRVTRFEGDGLYVYPDWGNPVVYEVKRNEKGALEFYYPGSKSRLWSMNQDNPGAVFGGLATGYLHTDDMQQAAMTELVMELQVPKHPVS